jgi:hypothetical protein
VFCSISGVTSDEGKLNAVIGRVETSNSLLRGFGITPDLEVGPPKEKRKGDRAAALRGVEVPSS